MKDEINWAHAFIYNEALHDDAQSLCGTYSRLRFHNPTHVDFEHWKREGSKWAEYERQIIDLVLPTEKLAQEECAKLVHVLRPLLLLEKQLLEKKGFIVYR